MTALSDEKTRECLKCLETKSEKRFSPGRNTCRDCRNSARTAAHARNPARNRSTDRARHVRDRDKRCAAGRGYRKENPEKYKTSDRAKYVKRKPAALLKVAEWQAANPRKVRTYRLNKYKITPEDADYLLHEQDYKCATCGSEDPGPKAFHIDHDHTSGRVRGFLCHSCNIGLGNFKDNPETLAAALVYLAVHDRPLGADILQQFLHSYPVKLHS